jgi:hypothetical protein
MSKKTKRQVRRTAPSVSSSTPTNLVLNNGSRGFDRDFSPDYSYVIKDLHRIGTLAGIFFAILIVLSFILR